MKNSGGQQAIEDEQATRATPLGHQKDGASEMDSVFLPVVAVPVIVSGRKTTFQTFEENVVVEAPSKLMRQLLSLCDGRHAFEEIVQCLEEEWDGEGVRGLLEALRHRALLVDARQMSEKAWKVVMNPSCFLNQTTDDYALRLTQKADKRNRRNPSAIVYAAQIDDSLGKLLIQRQSVRMFSGMPVGFQTVVNMLWSAYGALPEKEDGYLHRTIPSAGALYPLVLHVTLFKKTGNLNPAIYSVYLGCAESVGFRFVSDDIHRFARTFLDPLVLDKAHGVIVISGSFRIMGEKYGNRSMLYVPLEAGHAAQNIHLAAVEHNVATVEIGGFVDALLAEAICLPDHYYPLSTVVFGKWDSEVQVEVSKPKVDVQWAISINTRYHPPFAIASARLSAKRNWSHGRAASPLLAYIKAVAEAKEWAACGSIPDTLVHARLADLEKAIDPRDVISFHPAQYRLRRFPFKPFDEKIEYAWATGFDETADSSVHVLADLVYFPYFPRTPYYAYANSSGVAAHPDKRKAVETSTLELVERDSFMIAYLTQLEFPSVHGKSLPLSIRERIRELQKFGFRVWIKDHSLDLAPVVCVIAQSEELTYTPCASCASFDPEYAVNHALMEVEASVLARLENGPTAPLKPREVVWPLDHGRLYGNKRYFHQADFLIRGRRSIAFHELGKGVARSWQELLDRFAARGWRLFIVPLSLSDEYGGNDDLHIIRSIVPGMVPMTFGYRQEPAGMERIYAVAQKFGNSISYNKLTKFPHPFA